MKKSLYKKTARLFLCAVIIISLILCTACGIEKIGRFNETTANNSTSIGESSDITPYDEDESDYPQDETDETAGEYFFEVDEDDPTLNIEMGTVAQSVKKYTAKNKEDDTKKETSSDKESTSKESVTETTTVPAETTSAPATTKPTTATTTTTTSAPASTTRPRTTVTTTTWVYSTNPPVNYSDSFSGKFYYKMLTANQKIIYEAAYEAVSSGSATFEYVADGGFNKIDLNKGVHAFRNDFPEFCSLNGGYLSTQKGNDISVTLKTRDFCTDASGGSYRTELLSKVAQVASQAKQYYSNYDQIKYVHDYLCRTVEYDYDSYRKSSSLQTPIEQMSNTAYGALLNGRSVCGGISFAFSMIMEKLGYECGYISGSANGGNHAWNMIKAGGNYYCIDVTFDDHIEKNKNYIEYNYFCITSSEMAKTHTPGNEFTLPSANSNDLDFFNHNGYVIYSNYTEADYGIIAEQASNDYIYVKFTSESAYRQAKSGDSQLFADVRKATGQKSVSYYHDDDYLTLAFKT